MMFNKYLQISDDYLQVFHNPNEFAYQIIQHKTVILSYSNIIQQYTPLINSQHIAATYICNFANADPQTKKLQKNVSALP